MWEKLNERSRKVWEISDQFMKNLWKFSILMEIWRHLWHTCKEYGRTFIKMFSKDCSALFSKKIRKIFFTNLYSCEWFLGPGRETTFFLNFYFPGLVGLFFFFLEFWDIFCFYFLFLVLERQKWRVFGFFVKYVPDVLPKERDLFAAGFCEVYIFPFIFDGNVYGGTHAGS